MRHDQAAERPRQIASGENRKSLQLAQPVRNIRREEELADNRGEKDENDKVVELQRAAERGQRQRFVILLFQAMGSM